MDVDAELDRLYQQPLDRFVPERDALVKRLRKDDRDAAAEVKKLRRPSVAVWAVNQLWWREREAFERLLDAGEHVRRAQADRRRAPDAVADALAAQREVVADLLDRARRVLEEGSHAAESNLDAVRRTLAAMSAWGEDLPVTPGRLETEVEPPGFEALLGGLERPPLRPARPERERPARRPEPERRAAPEPERPASRPEPTRARPAPKAERAPAPPKRPDPRALRALADATEEVERLEAAARKAAEAADEALRLADEARGRAEALRTALREAERQERRTREAAVAGQDARKEAEKALEAARRREAEAHERLR